MERSEKKYEDKRSYGHVGERLLEKFFRRLEQDLIPVCDIMPRNPGGPELFSCVGNIKLPDYLAYSSECGVYWLEIKRQEAFSRYYGYLETGIGITQYESYCKIQERFPFDVYLALWHEGGIDEHSEPTPYGLYGVWLSEIIKQGRHSPTHGDHGSIFIEEKYLTFIADDIDIAKVLRYGKDLAPT